MAARALDAEAPYFVDYISQELEDKYQGVATGAVDVYTTLDLHLQQIAQDALRDGLVRIDELLARRKRQRAQAALLAVDPRTGEVLAFVGGRCYNQSQYNRVIAAKRQPGSVFKPFVYLAAFEHAHAEGRTDVTPATLVMDEPTSFAFNAADVEPGQLRRRIRRRRSRCGARSRCRATSPPSRSRKRPATRKSPRSGARSAPARRRGRTRRSRSASSRRRRSRSPPPTPCFPTAAR